MPVLLLLLLLLLFCVHALNGALLLLLLLLLLSLLLLLFHLFSKKNLSPSVHACMIPRMTLSHTSRLRTGSSTLRIDR